MTYHAQALVELNLQVAIFRDLLLGVGSARDSPDLRERIRKVRMDAMQEVTKTNNSLLPHIKRYIIGSKCLFSCKFISKSRKLLLTEITQKNFTRITFDLFVIFIKKLLQTGEKMKNKSNKEK